MRSGSHFSNGEPRMVEPPKFEIHFCGVRISAQGVVGIAAVVTMLILSYRF
jgi:hypothetical protein